MFLVVVDLEDGEDLVEVDVCFIGFFVVFFGYFFVKVYVVLY